MNFESKRRVSIRDLASAAGVSVATASRAMANHPQHSLETRSRIQSLALEIGYVRNPMVASLMADIRCKRSLDTEAVVALVHGPRMGRPVDGELLEIRMGIMERAVELGYRLDDFYLEEDAMNLPRLISILKARGIRGVLLEHFGLSEACKGEVDLSDFACVAVESRLAGSGFHSVDADQLGAVALAYGKAWDRGYRRIGLVTREVSEVAAGYRRLAAYLRCEAQNGQPDRLEPLNMPGAGEPDESNAAALGEWLSRYRIDAVLSPIDWVGRVVVERGLGFGHLALLDPVSSEFSGIDPHWRALGGLAMDRLSEGLERNRTGLPNLAVASCLASSWVEARETLPLALGEAKPG